MSTNTRTVVLLSTLLLLLGCYAEQPAGKRESRSVSEYKQFELGMTASEAMKHLPREVVLTELLIYYEDGAGPNDPVYIARLPTDEDLGVGLFFNKDKRLVRIDVPVAEK